MGKSFKLLKIPKDLTTKENRFYTAMPKLLVGRYDQNKWKNKVEELNKIMEAGDSWSIVNTVRFIIPFLALLTGSSYKKKVQTFIAEWNKDLGCVGVKILDVTEYAYTEMEIAVLDE